MIVQQYHQSVLLNFYITNGIKKRENVLIWNKIHVKFLSCYELDHLITNLSALYKDLAKQMLAKIYARLSVASAGPNI